MNHALGAGTVLSPVRAERLASAFELERREVLVDARAIVGWSGSEEALDRWLSRRHGWHSDEAFYFIRGARLEMWLSCAD